jgi:hypothetical protein
MGQIITKASGVQILSGAQSVSTTGSCTVAILYSRVYKNSTIDNQIFYDVVLEIDIANVLSNDSGQMSVNFSTDVNFGPGVCTISTSIPDQNNNLFYVIGISSNTIIIQYDTHTNGKIYLNGIIQGL